MTDAAKEVEAKARVLAVYPDAATAGWLDGTCAIFSDQAARSSDTGYLGWGRTQFRVNSYQADNDAWIDAASRLTAIEEPAKPTVDDELPPWIAYGCPTCGAKSGDMCSNDFGNASCMARVLLSAAPGDVREGVELPKLDEDCLMWIKDWDASGNHSDWSCCDSGAKLDCRERQLLAALQQVAEKDTRIEREYTMVERLKADLKEVTRQRDMHASNAVEMMRQLDEAKAELSRLRGETDWLKNGVRDFSILQQRITDAENCDDSPKYGRSGELKERDK